MIYILDEYENMVGALDNKAPYSCPYFDDLHIENIQTGVHTYKFSFPASHEISEKVVINGYVVRTDLDDKFHMFKILDIEEVANEDSYIKTVYTEHIAVPELLGNVVPPQDLTGRTLQQSVEVALVNTGWKVGEVNYEGIGEVIIENYMTALEAIHLIVESFGVDFQYEIVFKHGKVQERLIHLGSRRGRITNKRFTYGKDLIEVNRTVNSEGMVTALIGIGKSDDDGVPLTLTGFDAEQYRAGALKEGFEKVTALDYISSNEAYERYGKRGKHIFGIFVDDKAYNQYTLFDSTLKELKSRMRPRTIFEMSIITLERITGYESEKVRIGDTITIDDTTFIPRLSVQARVIEVTRSYSAPENDALVLGDYVPIRISNYDSISKIQQTITTNMGKWESGLGETEVSDIVGDALEPIQDEIRGIGEEVQDREYRIIRQTDEPLGTGWMEGQLWIDGNGKMHRWHNGKWESMFDLDIDTEGLVSQADFEKEVTKILNDLADKVDADWVDGQLISKADANKVYTIEEIDSAFNNVVSKTVYETDKDGIISDINNNTSAIQQNVEKIESKVSSEVYTQAINKINTDIEGKVGTEEITEIETRLESMDTAITETSEEIALKANSTDVYTRKETDGIVENVETLAKKNEAELKVHSEQIESSVSREEFDNLTFENRNLVLDSKERVINAIDTTHNYTRIDLSGNLESETQYTLSANVEFVAGVSDVITVLQRKGENENNGSVGDIPVVDSRMEMTFTTENADTSMLLFYAGKSGETDGIGVRFTNIKLENGPKATPHTQAPEDVDNKIDGNYSKLDTRITQTADSITEEVSAVKREVDEHSETLTQHSATMENLGDSIETRVTKTEMNTTIDGVNKDISDAESRITQTEKDLSIRITETTYNADMDELTTRMSEAETEIEVTAEGLSTKVSQTDYTGENLVTMIEQTPTTIKLSASKIDLEGYVTADDLKVKGNLTFGGTLDGATGVFSGKIQAPQLTVEVQNKEQWYDFGLRLQTAEWRESTSNPYEATGYILFNTSDNGVELTKENLGGMREPFDGFLVDSKTANFHGRLYSEGSVTTNSRATSGGFILGVGDTAHSLTRHNTNNYLVMYPQRYTGQDIFRIRSHHQRASYSNDFRITLSGNSLIRNSVKAPFFTITNGEPTDNESNDRYHFQYDSSGDLELISKNSSGNWFSRITLVGRGNGTGITLWNRMRSEATRDATTTNSANFHIFTSTGRMSRTTSARKYKLNEREIKENPYKLLDVMPKDWYDKTEVEEYAEALTAEFNGEEIDIDELDLTELRRIPGIVAEDVEDAGLHLFVDYDTDGEVQGVKYDRLWTLLIPIVNDLVQQINELKGDK